MIPWECLDRSFVPGNDQELGLYRRGDEFSIRVGHLELMNSRAHGSEDALAELACNRIAARPSPRMLVGGLGMGFTAAAALRFLSPESTLVVAELIPAVVTWNQGVLGHLAEQPLRDPRVGIKIADVADILRAEKETYDAILLDVDNGPGGLTSKANAWLYGVAGLQAASGALRPGGVLAVWSASADAGFVSRLRQAGFLVEEKEIRARGHRGSHHIVWLATRPRVRRAGKKRHS